MRTAIIIFTGIAIGIIVGISPTVNTAETNNTSILNSFTWTAFKHVGTAIDYDKDHITILFEDHLVRFTITENTTIDEFILRKKETFEAENKMYTSTTLDKLMNNRVYIIYTETENKLYADVITLLK